MTRFARAKGSKASNERVPEDSTPWSEIKQQLLEKNKESTESKNRQAAIDQRSANYKAFLQEKENEEIANSKWAEFPSQSHDKKSINTKGNKKIKQIANYDENESDEMFATLKAKVDKVLDHSLNTHSVNAEDSDAPPEESSSKIEVSVSPAKVKKVKKKKLSITIDSDAKNAEINKSRETEKKQKKNIQNENSHINESNNKAKTKTLDNSIGENQQKSSKKRKNSEQSTNQQPKKIQKNGKGSDNKKGKAPKKIVKENLSEEDLKKIEKKKQKRIKQLEKKKKLKEEKKKLKDNEGNTTEISNNAVNTVSNNSSLETPEGNVTNSNNKEVNQGKFEKFNKFKNGNKFEKFDKNKPKKLKDNKEHTRKKPLLPTKMFINGKEVLIDYVDGFPVKKEDAERLRKLRKEMISKGLPRSEINIALKLERRKAEKAFAREKKKVCFNCRKSGHNLSECPELGKDQMAAQSGTGICFKCGSTEHTHFECKVVRGQEYKYAQCFICNEQGHISRQCPDNARGLYPKGGACRVCGDVTHLKKDCPKYQAQQQQIENGLNVETIGSENPDVLDNNTQFRSNLGNRRPNKIIKF